MPQTVQTVLRMKMTKDLIDAPDTPEEFEKSAGTAIAWWKTMVTELNAAASVTNERPPSETELAELVIKRMRKTSATWGKILRGNAN